VHCSNPKCFEDSCKGECLEDSKEKEEERLWPWYRYEDTRGIEVKEEPKHLWKTI
jgi:hypothetical protein